MFFLQIYALLKKELIFMWLDPGTRNVLIFPIIIQAVIFGYAATFNLSHVPYSILNLSPEKQAIELIKEIEHNPYFDLIEQCYTEQCLNDSIDTETALIGIYIDHNFDQSHEIQVIADAKNTASANTAYMYLNTLIEGFNNKHGLTNATLNTRFVYNENTITRFSVLTGMILSLSMIQVLILSSLCISREREEGTFDMMLMTPTPTITLLIGKAAAPVMVSLFQGGMLFLVCRLYFEIPFRGDYLSLFGAILIFSTSLVGLGLAISTFANTTQQSIVIAFTFLMPMVILSSLLTPIDATPDWFRPIVYINPLFYGISCMQGIYLEGKNLFQLCDLILPLLVFAAITLSRCAYLFRHKLK